MRLRIPGRSNSTYTLLLVKFLCLFDSETFLEDSFPFERILKFYLKIHKSQNKEKKRNSFQGSIHPTKETPCMSSRKMSAALDAAISEIICVNKRELWLLDGIHRKPQTNHCLWNLRKRSQKSLCTKLVPICPVGSGKHLNASEIESVIKLYSFVFLVHYSC